MRILLSHQVAILFFKLVGCRFRHTAYLSRIGLEPLGLRMGHDGDGGDNDDDADEGYIDDDDNDDESEGL